MASKEKKAMIEKEIPKGATKKTIQSHLKEEKNIMINALKKKSKKKK